MRLTPKSIAVINDVFRRLDAGVGVKQIATELGQPADSLGKWAVNFSAWLAVMRLLGANDFVAVDAEEYEELLALRRKGSEH